VVFHVGSGDRYVSIERIDVARKAVTLAVHPKSDYDRIELQVGREVPDFEFIALDGSKRHLSDFRGKYLLMDFWGTWCGPCVGDLPLIKKAYDTYKDKGFEVLGMDTELPDVTAEDFEKGLAKVKAFVAERGIPWLQARTESIKPLYERRFMIVAYPTYVLLGPDGTIIRLSGLHGEELGKTLAALFNGK
jgi:thiol-disulfide isomerase/thioredoxin